MRPATDLAILGKEIKPEIQPGWLYMEDMAGMTLMGKAKSYHRTMNHSVIYFNKARLWNEHTIDMDDMRVLLGFLEHEMCHDVIARLESYETSRRIDSFLKTPGNSRPGLTHGLSDIFENGTTFSALGKGFNYFDWLLGEDS